MDAVIGATIGALVGAGELVGRYRDDPLAALTTKSAAGYIALMASASAAAVLLASAYGWTFGATGEDSIRWTRILVAGFGAMAVFRSAVFYVRVSGHEVGVGPAGFLQVVLSAADRSVDRVRARHRAQVIAEAMRDVPMETAAVALPAVCLALMQNVSKDDQSQLAAEIAEILNQKIEDRYKILTIGLKLTNVVGLDVLTAAAREMKVVASPQIPSTTSGSPTSDAGAASESEAD